MEVWLLFSDYIHLSGCFEHEDVVSLLLSLSKPKNASFFVQVYGIAKLLLCMEARRHGIRGIDVSMQDNRTHHFTDNTFQQPVSRQR